MKIGNIIISRKFILSFTMICLVVSAVVGYSYINTDLLSAASVTVRGQTCTANNLYNVIGCQAKLDSVKSEFTTGSGISFSYNSSDTNGKGIYTLTSTIDDNYPIHYYRGEVDNNNLIFGDYCWKIVRTTSTGGTKLVYNGLPTDIYPDAVEIGSSSYLNAVYDSTTTFDESNNEWTIENHTTSSTSTISFSVAEAGNYNLNYKISSDHDDNVSFYLDGVLLDISYHGIQQWSIPLTVTTSNVISVEYQNGTSSTDTDEKVIFSLAKSSSSPVLGCRNSGGGTLSQIGTSPYNSGSNIYRYLPSVGYMYGNMSMLGPYFNFPKTTAYIFSSDYSYENGEYVLGNDTTTQLDDTHHYTCLSTTDSTCTDLAFVYYSPQYDSDAAYVKLTGGKNLDTVLSEMVANTTDSNIKTAVDNWFANTFSTYFTNNSKDYNDYLEDTIFCNDRSMNTLCNTLDCRYINSGWNPNGGTLKNWLFFGSYGRSEVAVPNLTCPNKNDAFTVNDVVNGNGALTYPTGLLTADEAILAGSVEHSSSKIRSVYLYTSEKWYLMSPYESYGNNYSEMYTVSSEGALGDCDYYGGSCTLDDYRGVRPSISLKYGITSSSGNGTSTSPYVIE